VKIDNFVPRFFVSLVKFHHPSRKQFI